MRHGQEFWGITRPPTPHPFATKKGLYFFLYAFKFANRKHLSSPFPPLRLCASLTPASFSGLSTATCAGTTICFLFTLPGRFGPPLFFPFWSGAAGICCSCQRDSASATAKTAESTSTSPGSCGAAAGCQNAQSRAGQLSGLNFVSVRTIKEGSSSRN
jgi:hypothetical protein